MDDTLRPGPLDRALRLFGDVRAGEGGTVILMCANVFVLLVAYYVLKTVREPLILVGGGAELKSYAAAVQALALVAYVPAYGWAAARLPRSRFLMAVVLVFAGCIQLFVLAIGAGFAYVGFVFFVWVGIFSLTTIAQFWSYASEMYTRAEGDRLFPLIAVGSAGGAPVGAALATRLFRLGTPPVAMMELAAVLLLLHLALYRVIARRRDVRAARPPDAPMEKGNGFALVLRSRYLMLLAGLLVLLNVVNTVGEFILGRAVVAHADLQAAAASGFDREAYIGAFYGRYFFWTNVATILLQAFVVSRIARRWGMAGVLLALPLVAVAVYGSAAAGIGLSVLVWAKVAENSTDYSAMNTAKQMAWLPTTRAEKYKAKQAIDTFFVRAGDMLAGGLVYLGTNVLTRGAEGFARANLLVVSLAIVVAVLLVREHARRFQPPGVPLMKMHGVLVLSLLAGPALAQDAAAPATTTVTAGAQYAKGGSWRFWFGDGYRAEWTTPVTLPLLDLQHESGGLTPVRQVGGLQSVGLALKGADGHSYTFRMLVKQPERVLPPAWRNSAPAAVVKDQTAAAHPAASVVASTLARAVGIRFYRSRLMVMPDDPALGAFRQTFAGAVGTFDEYIAPGYGDVKEVVSTRELWDRWREGGAAGVVDSRAFLKARLLDVVIGNWDRHQQQWRWAHVEGQAAWEPLPEDADQAFTRYEGAATSYTRLVMPRLMRWKGEYPGRLEGLTQNNADVTRWIPNDLDWPAWQEVAQQLTGALTDAVIEDAVRSMPPQWYAIHGAEMVRDLRQRRDGLPAFARRFYLHLADRVDVRGCDRDELATVRRGEDGALDVTIAPRDAQGAVGAPTYHRRFLPVETQEVRLYLLGGDDRLLTTGSHHDAIRLRVMGGAGDDVLDDAATGHADLRDSEGKNTFVRGPGTGVDEHPWLDPRPDAGRPWLEPRGYGHWTMPMVQLWWEPDQEFMLGGGVTRTSWGFREYPWASQHTASVLFSTGYKKFRGSYTGAWRVGESDWTTQAEVFASGIENMRYYGLGNETAYQEKELAQTQLTVFSAYPSLRWTPSEYLQTHVGVQAKAIEPAEGEQTLLQQEQPYGTGKFGEVGLRAGFDLDTRGHGLGLSAQAAMFAPVDAAAQEKVSGLRLAVDGFLVPKAWDVTSDFGGVDGSLSGYLGSPRLSLATRVGGRKLWGTYPWFESAVIGGSDNVRGYNSDRFRGDSSLYANAEARSWLGQRKAPWLPLRWGLFAFAETGRVWLEGETSDKWHTGYGGGVMTQLVGVPLTASGSLAISDESTKFYFVFGYSF